MGIVLNCGCYRETKLINHDDVKPEQRCLSNDLLIFGCDKNNKSFIKYFNVKNMKIEDIETKAKLLNYSGCTHLNFHQLFIAGGINFQEDLISNDAQIYHIKKNVFEQLPKMKHERFNFACVQYNNHVYVCGGRTYGYYNQAILRSCEVFNLKTKTWSDIPDMNKKRCGHKLFIYQNKIYAIGGLSSDRKSKLIEYFDPSVNKWILTDIKLYFNIFNFEIFPKEDDEIYVIGGKHKYGFSNFIHVINLRKKTIKSDGFLNVSRSNFKMIFEKQNNCLYFFGGTLTNDELSKFRVLEKYNLITKESKKIMIAHQSSFEHFHKYNFNSFSYVVKSSKKKIKSTFLNCNKLITKPKENLNLFNPIIKQQNKREYNSLPLLRSQTIFLDNNEISSKFYSEINFKKSNFIFGCDANPFLFVITQHGKYMKLPIPIKIKLQNYQSIARISPHEVVLTGGVNYFFNKISLKTFLFNLQTKEVKVLSNLNERRFLGKLIFWQNRLIFIGGRTYGDNVQGPLNSCEEYDFKTNQWVYFPCLQKNRFSFSVTVFNDKMYVIGGTGSNSAYIQDVEVFNRGRWEVTGLKLQFPISNHVSFKFQNKIVLVGSSEDNKYSKINFIDMKFGSDLADQKIVDIKKQMSLSQVITLKNQMIIFGGIKNEILTFDFHSEKFYKSDKKNRKWKYIKHQVEKHFYNQHYLSKFSCINQFEY